MIDFVTGQSGNIIGAYPSVQAKNTSGAGATDGTALLANWVTNLWGMVQDLMQRAELTPSGIVEKYAAETGALPLGTTATQIRTAMQMAFGSPGELVLWSRSQAPATVGARVLLLQGQTIPIASYPDLVAACYCGDGVNNTPLVPFYKSSDAGGTTRSTSGTYFTLPDARGVTLRGIDIGNLRDPQGSTRGAGTPNGSLQLDAFQGHKFYNGLGRNTTYTVYIYDSTADEVPGSASQVFTPTAGTPDKQGTTSLPKTDGTNGTPRTSSETRMHNMATYIGIRY